MKRLFSIVLFVLLSVAVMGQMAEDYTVRFIGRLNDSQYQMLDSVCVTNTTRGWTETLVYPDTVIVVNTTVNVSDVEMSAVGFEQNVPNPFDCHTTVELAIPQDESVRLQLFDAAGKQCAELNVSLNAGSHRFEITTSKPQTYILKAVAGEHTYSVRMVNVGSGGGSDGIKYGSYVGLTAKLYSDNEFVVGDVIQYVGYATIEGNVVESRAITQALYISQEVILQFTYYFRPSVETLAASGIQTSQAKLYGSISSDGGSSVISRGFVYGTEIDNLSVNVVSSSESNTFYKTILGLTDATTYYYRAYAVNDAGTSYGDVMSFTTDAASSQPTGYVDGYGYVDLGLPSGMKWAVCNIGATNPEDYGNYYAWGETEAKSSYSWGTYMHCYGFGNRLTKYCSNSIYGNNGYTDNLSFLDASDDVATVSLGESWRLPTSEEMNELFNSCTMTWTIQNGISGCLLTGPNENSIFLPNAGYVQNANSYNQAGFGCYWTNSLDVSNPQNSWMFSSNSSNTSVIAFNRYYGMTARPVCVYDPSASPVRPTVITGTASNVTITSAKLSGYISNNGGAPIISSGFVYGTSQDDLSMSVDGDVSSGTYDMTIDGLLGDTTYYYRAYATNSEGVGYGEIRSFSTPSYSPATGFVDGYGYVDLGLPSGTLWATCNVGADNPDDFGGYYAWAETESKESYMPENYRYYDNSYSGYTKYCTDPTYGKHGFTDNKTILDMQDDVATANMGANWRTPLSFEYDELRNNCTIEYTTQNGVNGALYTGPNGNSIFLPAAGRVGANIYGANEYGYYWIGHLDASRPYYALNVYFNMGTCLGNYSISNFYRYWGLPVRPVCKSLHGSQDTEVPTVLTVSSSMVTSMGAVVNGYVLADGGDSITSRGFVYGTGGNLNRTKECSLGIGVGDYSVQLEDLSPSTTYFYMAYAVNADGTSYGDVKSFTTSEQGQIAGYANGHSYVDLGLPSGTLWATTNVGAANPEGYGDYYAWGETEQKETYSIASYIHCMGTGSSYTKYCTESQYGNQGFVDSLITLEPMDDAATVHWGSNWRMPSNDEKEELRNNCTMTFVNQNGVVGALLTGPNGNSIFLPAAGFWSNNHYCEEGTTCAYWTGMLSYRYQHYSSTYAEAIFIRSSEFYSSSADRSLGYTVRPVRAFPQDAQTTEMPSVQTYSLSSVTANNATLNGNVVTDGADLVSLGFVYGTSENDLSYTIECGSVEGNYNATLVGLASGTTYYYKAFATNSAGTAYGAIMSFETVQQTCPDVGNFTDGRDGNSYTMVTIGTQTWMAENLRYEGDISLGNQTRDVAAFRYYPNNDRLNVRTYGYLYNWTAIMNGSASSSENPSGVQGICPSGWHLPSNAEWWQLCDALGGNNIDLHYNNPGSQLAGNAELWTDGFLDLAENFGITGFNALPAGGYSPNNGGYCYAFGNCAEFWTATETDESVNHVRIWGMVCSSTNLGDNYETKGFGHSVRCVRDN